jgi:hypothetical protein
MRCSRRYALGDSAIDLSDACSHECSSWMRRAGLKARWKHLRSKIEKPVTICVHFKAAQLFQKREKLVVSRWSLRSCQMDACPQLREPSWFCPVSQVHGGHMIHHEAENHQSVSNGLLHRAEHLMTRGTSQEDMALMTQG